MSAQRDHLFFCGRPCAHSIASSRLVSKRSAGPRSRFSPKSGRRGDASSPAPPRGSDRGGAGTGVSGNGCPRASRRVFFMLRIMSGAWLPVGRGRRGGKAAGQRRRTARRAKRETAPVVCLWSWARRLVVERKQTQDPLNPPTCGLSLRCGELPPPPPTLDPQPPPEMSRVSSIIVEHGSAGKLMLRLILIVEPRVVSTCQGNGWVRHQGAVHLQKGEGKSRVAFKLPGGGGGKGGEHRVRDQHWSAAKRR